MRYFGEYQPLWYLSEGGTSPYQECWESWGKGLSWEPHSATSKACQFGCHGIESTFKTLTCLTVHEKVHIWVAACSSYLSVSPWYTRSWDVQSREIKYLVNRSSWPITRTPGMVLCWSHPGRSRAVWGMTSICSHASSAGRESLAPDIPAQVFIPFLSKTSTFLQEMLGSGWVILLSVPGGGCVRAKLFSLLLLDIWAPWTYCLYLKYMVTCCTSCILEDNFYFCLNLLSF